MEQFGTNHGQSFLSNCDTAMQKSREDKKKCWIPSIKNSHTKNNYNYSILECASIAAADYCDRSRKEKITKQNEISFKTILTTKTTKREKNKTTEFCHSI
jgi:hypothetical protein